MIRRAMWQRAFLVLAVLLVVQLVLLPAASAWGGTSYLVRRGDTLSSIARRFGVTVNCIAQANGIVNPNRIFAGQCLVIPSGCGGVSPCTTCGGGCIHIVQRGETLTSIACRFGTSVCTLQRLNGIANPNLIFAGMHLRVC